MKPLRPHREDDGDVPDLPRLSDALKRLYEPPGDVPDAVREQLMHQAGTELGNLRRSRRWGGIAIVAAAAMIVLTFQLILQQVLFDGPARNDNGGPAGTIVATATADVDGNGRIDILDAFVLARRVDNSQPTNQQWDFNGDGVVDRRDVDLVAQAAVRLKGGA